MASLHVPDRPVLVCPECQRNGHKGHARIGNRKSKCSTCNRYSAKVRNLVASRLRALNPALTEQLTRQAEREAYAQMIGSTE